MTKRTQLGLGFTISFLGTATVAVVCLGQLYVGTGYGNSCSRNAGTKIKKLMEFFFKGQGTKIGATTSKNCIQTLKKVLNVKVF